MLRDDPTLSGEVDSMRGILKLLIEAIEGLEQRVTELELYTYDPEGNNESD